LLANRIQTALRLAQGPVCNDCLQAVCLIGDPGVLTSLQKALEEEGLVEHAPGKCAICHQEQRTSWMANGAGKQPANGTDGPASAAASRGLAQAVNDGNETSGALEAVAERMGKQAIATREILARLASLETTVQRLGEAVQIFVASNPPGGRFAVYQGDHLALTRVLNLFKMYVDTTEVSLAPHLMMDGRWEPDITRVFEREIRKGMTVADVGANWVFFYAAGGSAGRTGGARVCGGGGTAELHDLAEKHCSKRIQGPRDGDSQGGARNAAKSDAAQKSGIFRRARGV